MAKKDLRNGKESGRWKPHKWSSTRAARQRRHALEYVYEVLCCDVGGYQAALAVVEVQSLVSSAISRDAVHAAGMKTLGE